MPNIRQAFRWSIGTGIVLLGTVGLASGIAYRTLGRTTETAQAEESAPRITNVPVRCVHPRKGVLGRLSTQPGTIQAYQSVDLYAKVPGFLKTQNVDIGDEVKRGQVLAIVDVPELDKQVQRSRAALAQSRSRVLQMKAHVSAALADLEARKAAVKQADATAKSSAAWVRFRSKQLQRMKELFALKSIDERLVDENQERYEASVETEQSSQAAILTAKANVAASQAKIEQAQADVAEAESEVQVAQAELEKNEVQVAFATIRAPFDGVIVNRRLFPGDFVRSANEGGNHEPLLTVHRTDLMRVVVQVPDRDVPFMDPGDPAFVELDALGGKKWTAKVARIAHSEDPHTRLMHVEIDLPNPTGKICQGMYGRVSIVLDKSTDQLSIPSACLVGKAGDGVGTVYVVRDGHIHLTRVRLGIDNGLRVAVPAGLQPGDEVVVQPGNNLAEGLPVNATLTEEEAASAADH